MFRQPLSLSIQALRLIAVALVGGATLATVATLWALRADALRSAELGVDNVAFIFAEQIDRSVEGLDAILNEFADRAAAAGIVSEGQFRHGFGTQPLFAIMRERLARLPHADFITVYDSSGRALNSTRDEVTAGMDFSDRDYFKYLSTHGDTDMYVSGPVTSRVTGAEMILFSKRINGAFGDFVGGVTIGVEIQFFQRSYDSIRSLPDQSFLFMRRDGTILVRYPDPDFRAGEVMPADSHWHDLVAQGGGFYRAPGGVPGEAQLMAVHPLRDYPLVANVAVLESTVLATWQRRAMLIAFATALAALCAALLLRMLATKLARLADSEASLADSSRALESVNHRLDASLNNLSQGLCMFDANERLVLCNRRFLEIFRLPAGIALEGCTYRQLLDHCAAAGTLGGDPAQYCADLLATIASAKPKNVCWDLPDGRTLSVIDQPIAGGGWITTYYDITLRRLVERERDQERELANLIFENVSSPIYLKDVRDRRFVSVNRAAETQLGRMRADILGKTVYDVHDQATADTIAGQEDQTLLTDSEQVFEAYPVCIQGIRRVSVAKRMIIRDDSGAPKYILGVVDDVTERMQDREQIEYLASHDSLTGLTNRAQFIAELDRALARAQRGERFALLYLDLDHFKRVNDTLGHLIGDDLLKGIADRLRSCVRETDVVARLGGDEFAVLQAPVAHPSDTAALATRISKLLNAPFEFGEHKAGVSVSIGISIAPQDTSERDQLLQFADLALYAAKENGRGSYHFYEADLDTRMKARQKLETDLRDALAKGEFELHYQPIVNLDSNRIDCCEALLRWHHPERGMVAPAEFIAVAEESGIIVALGEWVLRQACTDAATWPDGVRVAVNISAAQFKCGTLGPLVVRALAASRLSASRLEIEITETVLMQDTFATLSTLHQLRDLGVRISMDDFGIGYSSLSYLRSFPFDKIKIDRSFIENISEKDNCVAIVQAVTTMANRLGMTTAAEGIETEDQRRKVQELGCTEMQGYLFSRPLPAADLARRFFGQDRADRDVA